MLFIAVFCIICFGFYTSAMSIVGLRSFIHRHDWHFLAGSFLYAVATFFIFENIF